MYIVLIVSFECEANDAHSALKPVSITSGVSLNKLDGKFILFIEPRIQGDEITEQVTDAEFIPQHSAIPLFHFLYVQMSLVPCSTTKSAVALPSDVATNGIAQALDELTNDCPTS